MFTELNLDTLLWLQENRTGVLDILAYMLHVMGLSPFYLLTLTLVYWSIDRHLGLWLLFALVVSGVGTTIVKEWTAIPRPYLTYPDQLSPLVTQSSYSFPSGHVSQAIVMWGALVIYIRRHWLLGLVGVLAVLEAWSRMYLGVHYPTDVVAGLLLGILLLLVLRPISLWLRWIHTRTTLYSQLVAVVTAGLLIFISSLGRDYGTTYAGLTLGAGIGLVLETQYVRFSTAGTPWERLIRYWVGVLWVGVVYGVFSFLAPADNTVWQVITYTVAGLVTTFGYPAFAVRFGLMPRREALETVVETHQGR